MATSTGKVILSLAQADGSTRNVTADLANLVETIVPAKVIVPPPPPPAAAINPDIPANAGMVDVMSLADWGYRVADRCC
jgi:hypothetical protein